MLKANLLQDRNNPKNSVKCENLFSIWKTLTVELLSNFGASLKSIIFGRSIKISSEGYRASRAVVRFRKSSSKQLFNQGSTPVVIDRLALDWLLVLALRRLGHAVIGGPPGHRSSFHGGGAESFWRLVDREAGWLLVQLG